MTAAGASPPPAAGRARAQTFLVVVFFAALFFSLTLPAFDSDFWWHLASGRWMWEHRQLLHADPFDFTSVIFASSSQSGYQLTQYWMAQVLLYGAYLVAGLNGVVLLRAAVFTALFYFLYRLLRRTGAGRLLSVLLLSLAFQAIVRDFVYIAARPQMWSSMGFVALLLLLEHLREGKRWAQFALPAFMLIWANLHGGYILGVIVIVISAAAAYLSRHVERRNILVAAVASIALTGCTPSGYTALISYPLLRFTTTPTAATGIFEEGSLFTYVKIAKLPWMMPGLAAVFLLPLLTLLPRVKSLLRERWDLLLIYLLTLGMGIKAQRFLIFMVPMACWITAINIAAWREYLPQVRQWTYFRLLPRRVPEAATAVVLVSLTLAYALLAARTSVLRPAADYHHEIEGAADYLQRNGFRGNIFNDYNNGGYLAWRLPPGAKIFVYGRMVYPELLALYNDVVNRPAKTASLTASGDIYYFYQKILDENSIDAVIIPAGVDRTGDAIPLTTRLAGDDAWALVYARPEALIFVRKTPALASLVAAALPKSTIFDNQIAVARMAAQTSHGRSSPVWRRSLALAYYGQGRKEESLRMLDEYIALVPKDTKAVQLRDSLAKEIGRQAR